MFGELYRVEPTELWDRFRSFIPITMSPIGDLFEAEILLEYPTDSLELYPSPQPWVALSKALLPTSGFPNDPELRLFPESSPLFDKSLIISESSSLLNRSLIDLELSLLPKSSSLLDNPPS